MIGLGLMGWLKHALMILFFLTVSPVQCKPNVLFIVADDQRTNLGCYGDPQAITPNFDKLAAAGIKFNRAYCQYAMCGPSRASILTGLRPDSIKVYDLHTKVRKYTPEVLTLPQDFKNRGYFTRAIGKVFHPGIDDPKSWSMPTFPGPEIVGTTSVTSGTVGGLPDVTPGPGGGKRGPSWFAPDLPEHEFHDGVITREVIKAMNDLKDRPFFLAVGYNRPHLPFVAPKKYFDLYGEKTLLLPENGFPPKDVPDIAMTQSGELRQYRDIPATGPLSLAKRQELTLAYYACTSFVDAQMGRLLDELKRLDLEKDTIVVFWGDHGFHLGEHSIWAKYTNFEVATRAPLILKVPSGRTTGTVTSVVEFVDVYPTLTELCGWRAEGTEGKSLAGYVTGALEDNITNGRGLALSQVNRGDGMGYSLRTDRYRYTEWRREDGLIAERELYDHMADHGENRNMAGEVDNEATMRELHEQIEEILSGTRVDL